MDPGSGSGVGRSAGCDRGFTLVELLVVIGIIAVLIAILMPALVKSRENARIVQCASNVRQLCQALLCYSGDFKGRFPPNISKPTPGQYWCERDRIGNLVPYTLTYGGNYSVGGPSYTCPNDTDAQRSYSMNIWASSKADATLTPATRGALWASNVRDGSRLILVTEGWSANQPNASSPWFAPAYVGAAGDKPGQRFGAGGGIQPPAPIGRWGTSTSELAYYRHRNSSVAYVTDPVGRVNIGYADGHVAMKSESDLADTQTGLSRLDSLWSPADPDLNQ